MEHISVNKENFDNFIIKGSLALKSYYDITYFNKELFDDFNSKLKKYTKLPRKNKKDKESIVNELAKTIEKIGIQNFTIYDDGDVEFIYSKID